MCGPIDTECATQTPRCSFALAIDSLRQHTKFSTWLEQDQNWRCDFDHRLQDTLTEQVIGLARLTDILAATEAAGEPESGIPGVTEVDRALREAKGELQTVRGRRTPVEMDEVTLVTELLVASGSA